MTRRSYNKQYFATPTLDNCYWGGFLAADGTVSTVYNSVKLHLAEKDLTHLQKFKDVIEYDGNLLHSKSTKSYGIQLYGAERWIYDLENNFNIIPNKSLVLKPPYGLTCCGAQCELAFLAGYIDGDGCIRYDKRDGLLHLDVFSGSLRLVNWAKLLVERTFGIPDKPILSYGNRSHLYRLNGRNAEIVRTGLQEISRFQMPRKWHPVVPAREPRNRRLWNLVPR